MRMDYKLTDQTRRTLDGHIKQVAEAMDVSDKHLYAIMANSVTDPFALFERLYKACVIAGVSTAEFDNRLAALRHAYARQPQKQAPMTKKVIEKIMADAGSTNELLKAMEDGQIDQAEARRALIELQKQEAVTSRLKKALLTVLGTEQTN